MGGLKGISFNRNYGADWGDYMSFVKHMKQTALNAGVDLLLVDTGDLHDGTGLSDATSPDGAISNIIFENVPYDLATIGNHELYVTAVAYETWQQFSKHYGDRYVTSNVQIYNPSTSKFEFIGNRYKYFTTRMGLRIMSFGFLYDFTGNSNVSKVIKAADTVNATWFKHAVNFHEPIDLFLVLGHNPVRPTVGGSTFGTIYNAIRTMRPDVPIQFFGGHTHIRDFVVFDNMATGLESGRYCETLGWLSMTGLNYLNYSGPPGLPIASQPAVKVVSTIVSQTSTLPVTGTPTLVTSTTSTSQVSATASVVAPTGSSLRYARRYLDWNRLTFEFHANGSQVPYPPRKNHTSKASVTPSTLATIAARAAEPTPAYHDAILAERAEIERRQLSRARYTTFDTKKGQNISGTIYQDRLALNLTYLLGCAPQSWCQSCAPFMSSGNIYSILSKALSAEVVQPARSTVPRLILLNTGSVRYDLTMGPFTLDDQYIVSPFDDTFQYIPDVPYSYATQILAILNTPGHGGRRRRDTSLSPRDFGFTMSFADTFRIDQDECTSPHLEVEAVQKRSVSPTRRIIRRQSSNTTTPGYTTTDDFGTDGDDTIHTSIPYYSQPTYFQANASLPADGSAPATVDVIFLDYFASEVVSVLNSLGDNNVTAANVQQYLPVSFTTQSYLPAYAARASEWQVNKPNCPLM